jgi:hypothetical protein
MCVTEEVTIINDKPQKKSDVTAALVFLSSFKTPFPEVFFLFPLLLFLDSCRRPPCSIQVLLHLGFLLSYFGYFSAWPSLHRHFTTTIEIPHCALALTIIRSETSCKTKNIKNKKMNSAKKAEQENFETQMKFQGKKRDSTSEIDYFHMLHKKMPSKKVAHLTCGKWLTQWQRSVVAHSKQKHQETIGDESRLRNKTKEILTHK